MFGFKKDQPDTQVIDMGNAVPEFHPLELVDEPGPAQMMIDAKQAGFNAQEIQEMMDLQDRHDKRQAKKAFDQAMAAFKRNPPKVYKDMVNSQYSSGYTSIGNLVSTVNEAMGPYGLNARWDFTPPENAKPGLIYCTCILAHAQGHEVSVTLDGEADTSGAKNPLQQRRSTRTYLRIETFEAVTGMASQYNIDDDGNASGSKEPQALPPMSADRFATNKPEYEKAVAGGKKTAAELIAFLSTKYTLTPDQIVVITNMED